MCKNEIYFILGGSRSGKSSYALNLAETFRSEKTFIATCPVFDPEMELRIQNHKKERENRNWHTKEETIDLIKALSDIPERNTVLIDCITLWLNNLLYEEIDSEKLISDETIFSRIEDLISKCRIREGRTFIVSNETGLGIIPDNPLARRFRDLSGRCNQIIASSADHVYFLTAGIASKIK